VSAPGDLTLVATASDAEGVTKVEFYEQLAGVDASPTKIAEAGTPPYGFQRTVLSSLENGTHSFTAKAYDAAGNVGTSAVENAVVNLPSEPSAFALSVSHDRITTPGRITFTTEASEGLSRLEIFERGIKVGEAEAANGQLIVPVEVSSQQNGSRVYVGKGYSAEAVFGFSDRVTVVVDVGWNLIRAIEGIITDDLIRIAADASGASYIATTLRTETSGDIDLTGVLAKYDQEGNRSWTRSVGGSEDWESVHSIGVDPSGRVHVAGYVSYEDGRNADCFLTVFDAAGSVVWSRLLDTPLSDVVCVAAAASSGSFYVSGAIQEQRSGGDRTDVVVAKYDRDGTRLWIREFGSSPGFFGDDIPTSIAVDPLEGIYVAGYTSGSMEGFTNQGGRDIFIAKFDADGNQIWERQLGTGDHDFATSLAGDTDGGVYVAGNRDNQDIRFGPFGDAVLARYGADGAVLWERTLNGGYYDDAWGVVADGNGVQLVGRTTRGASADLTEPTQGISDAYLAQFSRAGELQSARLLGGRQHDGGTGVALGPAGDVYMALSSGGGLPGAADPGPVLARHRPGTP
jgi:hypothetical protein